MPAISGATAQFLAASGTSTSFTDEALTDAGDHKTYTIATSSKRYWDDGTTVVIQESQDSGSTWNAITPTSVQYPGGSINFAVARNSAYQYRAHSGKYFTITTIGGAHEWDLTLNAELYDATDFASGGWKTFIAGLRSGSGSVQRYFIDAYFVTLLVSGAVRGIIALYVSTGTGARYEGYVFINQLAEKTPVNGLVEDTLTFTTDKTLYYNPGP